MMNLKWKTDGQAGNLIRRPFEMESEFEKYVFDNQGLLGDVYIIYRQVRNPLFSDSDVQGGVK